MTKKVVHPVAKAKAKPALKVVHAKKTIAVVTQKASPAAVNVARTASIPLLADSVKPIADTASGIVTPVAKILVPVTKPLVTRVITPVLAPVTAGLPPVLGVVSPALPTALVRVQDQAGSPISAPLLSAHRASVPAPSVPTDPSGAAATAPGVAPPALPPARAKVSIGDRLAAWAAPVTHAGVDLSASGPAAVVASVGAAVSGSVSSGSAGSGVGFGLAALALVLVLTAVQRCGGGRGLSEWQLAVSPCFSPD